MPNFIVAANFLSFILFCLFIWSCIWSHLAFRRWEERENTKVRALQQIAAHYRSNKRASLEENLPEWAATR